MGGYLWGLFSKLTAEGKEHFVACGSGADGLDPLARGEFLKQLISSVREVSWSWRNGRLQPITQRSSFSAILLLLLELEVI